MLDVSHWNLQFCFVWAVSRSGRCSWGHLQMNWRKTAACLNREMLEWARNQCFLPVKTSVFQGQKRKGIGSVHFWKWTLDPSEFDPVGPQHLLFAISVPQILLSGNLALSLWNPIFWHSSFSLVCIMVQSKPFSPSVLQVISILTPFLGFDEKWAPWLASGQGVWLQQSCSRLSLYVIPLKAKKGLLGQNHVSSLWHEL